MNKELIERLAEEAGADRLSVYGAPLRMSEHAIYAFAALVAEECAKTAEATTEQGAPDMGSETKGYASAEAIRQMFKET